MKNVLLLLFAICAIFSTNGQEQLKLSLSNPQPRVGDEVKLTFSMEFLIDDIKKQLGPEVEYPKSNSFYGGSNETFEKTISFNEEGNFFVGPFKFDFNGTQYTTDSIAVNVAKKLPYEPGVWVRYVESNGMRYIILEQLALSKTDVKKKGNSISYSSGDPLDGKYADIVENPGSGVQISFRGSRSKSRDAKNSRLGDDSYWYVFKKYEVTFSNHFKGPFTLKKEHFVDLPRKTKIQPIEIY